MFFTLETPKKETIDDGKVFDFLAIGGGPAGLNGALYAYRKGLSTALVAQEFGGQLRNTSSVDNYLGFETIEAGELIDRFVGHVKAQGVSFINGRVLFIKKSDGLFSVGLEDGQLLKAKTVLAAFGGSPRKLGVPGEEDFKGQGVSYCATCDAPFFKGKKVVVAGGGNSAVEAAIDLSKWASHVTIVHRSTFRADKTLLERLPDYPTIDVRLETKIVSIEGQESVSGIKIRDKITDKESVLPADGIFIEIGTIPNSGLLTGLVEMNDRGEVLTNRRQKTMTDGLYAAGDITDQPHRQIVIAASEGAIAALDASEYLTKKGI